jgi:hypothetical protein
VHRFSKNVAATSKCKAPEGQHIENPQILSATIQNLVVIATWICALLPYMVFIHENYVHYHGNIRTWHFFD